jgi:hypothetical protein
MLNHNAEVTQPTAVLVSVDIQYTHIHAKTHCEVLDRIVNENGL